MLTSLSLEVHASYIHVASAALLVYDCALTFGDEVALVWPSRWSPTKILFFFNRYSPFLDTFITVHLVAVRHESFDICLPEFKIVAWLLNFGLYASEGILMIRTYALWHCSRRIFWMFCILFPLLVVSMLTFTGLFLDSLKYGPAPSPVLPGCFATQGSDVVVVSFLVLVLLDTVIVVLAFIKGYVQLRQVNTPFVHTLYEDGLLYYIAFLIVSIANVLLFVAAPPEFANTFTTPLRVIHSILCTHVVLRLRACIRDRLQNLDADGQAPFTITAVAFTTPHAPIGIDTLQDLESQVDNWSIMSDDSSISGE